MLLLLFISAFNVMQNWKE